MSLFMNLRTGETQEFFPTNMHDVRVRLVRLHMLGDECLDNPDILTTYFNEADFTEGEHTIGLGDWATIKLPATKPPTVYRHVFTIAFRLESTLEGKDVTALELLTGLRSRLAGLEENFRTGSGTEIIEATGTPFATHIVDKEGG